MKTSSSVPVHESAPTSPVLVVEGVKKPLQNGSLLPSEMPISRSKTVRQGMADALAEISACENKQLAALRDDESAALAKAHEADNAAMVARARLSEVRREIFDTARSLQAARHDIESEMRRVAPSQLTEFIAAATSARLIYSGYRSTGDALILSKLGFTVPSNRLLKNAEWFARIGAAIESAESLIFEPDEDVILADLEKIKQSVFQPVDRG